MNNSKFWNSEQPAIVASPRKSGMTKILLIIILVVLGIAGLTFALLAAPVKSVVSSVNLAKSDGNAIAAALSDRDLVALDASLNKFAKDLTLIKNNRDKNFGWAKNIKLFKLSEFYADTDHFINAGFYSIDALKEIETVVTPFADAAGLKVSADQQVPQDGGLMEAFQSWVSLMPQVAGQLDGVIEKITKVGKEFESVNVAKYPVKIGKTEIRSNLEFAKSTLANVSSYGPDIKQALTVFPEF